MSEFFRQLSTQARADKLSQNEKQTMRVRLYNHMEHNPLVAVTKAGVTPTRPVPSAFYWYSPRFVTPVALVLIVTLSGGTAFASQDSLPGDTLYPFKVGITEQLQLAIAWSDESKAAVNASIAESRLIEAEELAQAGRLDEKTSATLAANFDAHAEAAHALVIKIEDKDPGIALQISTELDSKLQAHAAILDEVSSDSEAKVISNSGSLAFADKIRAKQKNVDFAYNDATTATLSIVADTTSEPQTGTPENTRTMMAPTATSLTMQATAPASSSAKGTVKTNAKLAASTSNETTKSKSTEDKTQKAAASMLKQASSSIQTTIKNYNKIKSSLTAEVIAEIDARLSAVTGVYADGVVAYNSGDFDGAKSIFTESIKLSTKLNTYLKAGKKLHTKILSPLLGISAHVEGASLNSGKATDEDSSKKEANNTTVHSSSSVKKDSGKEVEDSDSDETPKKDPATTPGVKVEGSVKVEVGL